MAIHVRNGHARIFWVGLCIVFLTSLSVNSARLSVLALLCLYGVPWLIWGDIGYSTETLHPMLLLCAMVAAYYGVVSGLMTLALAMVPFAAFDLVAREINTSFHSYLLHVLLWPALAAMAVLLLGSARDLQEKRLEESLSKIEKLEREAEALKEVADAALSALRQNEAKIAKRRQVNTLAVLEALEQLNLGNTVEFDQGFAHLLRLVAPDADFALLSEDGDILSTSSEIDHGTLHIMHNILPSILAKHADPDHVEVSTCDGMTVAACPVNGRTDLVLCVSYSTGSAIDDLVNYLPQFAKSIDSQARFLAPAGDNKTQIRAIA